MWNRAENLTSQNIINGNCFGCCSCVKWWPLEFLKRGSAVLFDASPHTRCSSLVPTGYINGTSVLMISLSALQSCGALLQNQGRYRFAMIPGQCFVVVSGIHTGSKILKSWWCFGACVPCSLSLPLWCQYIMSVSRASNGGVPSEQRCRVASLHSLITWNLTKAAWMSRVVVDASLLFLRAGALL